jgi:Tol biopolymer transport system component
MYRIDDMATWRAYRRDLLREAEDARLARSVKEARPKRGQTLTGKTRRGAALLLSMVGLAAVPTPTRSSPARGEYWQPAWSPDGSRLAVSTDAGPIGEFGPARFGLAIVDVDSKEVTQVLDHKSAEGQDQFASWSPDGKRLAFYGVRSKSGQDQVEGIGQTAVFVVNIDGSGLRRLTPWNMLAGDPDWSPNGDLIAFSTRPLLHFTSGRSELYTIRPDGSGMRALTSHGEDGPRATQPQWTAGGEAILYTRANQSLTTRHVWAIDRTGGKDAPVLTEKSAYTQPSLQPR